MTITYRPLLLAALSAAVTLGGCRWLKGPAPTPTEGQAPGSAGQTGAVAVVSFSEVHPILKRTCATSCHDGQESSVDDFVFVDDGSLHRRLLTAAPGTVPSACQNRPLVVPGSPDASLLVAMVEEPDGPRRDCAERMPHNCPDRRPCLTGEEIGTIRRWIKGGALP